MDRETMVKVYAWITATSKTKYEHYLGPKCRFCRKFVTGFNLLAFFNKDAKAWTWVPRIGLNIKKPTLKNGRTHSNNLINQQQENQQRHVKMPFRFYMYKHCKVPNEKWCTSPNVNMTMECAKLIPSYCILTLSYSQKKTSEQFIESVNYCHMLLTERTWNWTTCWIMMHRICAHNLVEQVPSLHICFLGICILDVASPKNAH